MTMIFQGNKIAINFLSHSKPAVLKNIVVEEMIVQCIPSVKESKRIQ